MSAIDIQNSRQIRDPMDVLITLSLGTDIAMTYSGYSSAKIADGVLNQSSWPMRGLADLQGNGFPLDGSRVLYNPNTSPSQTNGKLGVRGNVGQPVSVTATGNDTIASLAISVTGAASVTLNGETTEITGSHVTLQLLNTTAALTFQPSSEDRRVEIITVLPEADFVINNDNLIKATVSLRSDLSIINPTLPESELTVEVYQDLDVSEAVGSIPEDTPITYQAGYPGDMSPVRRFYVSGQVTWKDNVLSIQAVDAVHFLDKELAFSLGVGTTGYYDTSAPSVARAQNIVNYLVKDAGVPGVTIKRTLYFYAAFYNDGGIPPNSVIEKGKSYRDIIAKIMNLFHIDNIPTKYTANRETDLWITYVDAGIPQVTNRKPQSKWTIQEEDAASVNLTAERQIQKINATVTRYQRAVPNPYATPMKTEFQIGTVDWVKGEGAFVAFDDYSARYLFGLSKSDGAPLPQSYFEDLVSMPILPAGQTGRIDGLAGNVMPQDGSSGNGSNMFFDNDTPQRLYDSNLGLEYTQIIPWNSAYADDWRFAWKSQSAAWAGLVAAGLIGKDDQSFTLKIIGDKVLPSKEEVTYSANREGVTVDAPDAWFGSLLFATEYQSGVKQEVVEGMPRAGYESLLKRSNVTCSFTWKGDPRIQPRDVFTFHRLDGTDEEWTFENITITHEGGGTLAEVTARKGIV